MNTLEKCKVLSNQCIAPQKYLITVASKSMEKGLAGQFYMLETKHQYAFLKRPISLYSMDLEQITFYYDVLGKGTQYLSELKEGDEIEIQGPIGTGFTTTLQNQNILVIGGGLGIAPLNQLIKQLKPHNQITFLAGGRNAQALAILQYMQLGGVKTLTATDDGSQGIKGNTVDLLQQVLQENTYDYIYVCGPHIMMEKIAQIALSKNIKCEVSLETRMACGAKICVGCSIKTKTGMKKVCGEGPVFDASIINWTTQHECGCKSGGKNE